MANITPIDGSQKIKDNYQLINTNDAAINQQLEDHINGVADKHNSSDIVNDSGVSGASQKDVNDSLQGQIDAIEVGDSNALIGVYKATDAVNTDNYAVTIATLTLFDGLRLNVEVFNQNTGPVTVNLNAIGAKSVVHVINNVENVLTAGQFKGIMELQFDVSRDKFKAINVIEAPPAVDQDLVLANQKGVAENRLGIGELFKLQDAQSRITDADLYFYDYAESSHQLSAGKIDHGKAAATIVNTGTNQITFDTLLKDKDGNVPANLSDCFIVGDQVTVDDAAPGNTEKKIVQAVDDGTKTVTFTTNIANTFASGANVYRSNVKEENNKFVLGNIEIEGTVDLSTPEVLVAQNYQTDKGTKTTVLQNGWVVYGLRNINTDFRFYAKKPDGTISYLGLWNLPNGTDIAVTSKENYVHFTILRSGSTFVKVGRFDATEAVGGDLTLLTSWFQESRTTAMTSMTGCDISISEDGSSIFYAFTGTTNTYPSSENLFVCIGTLSGQTPTWGSETQRTTYNAAGENVSHCKVHFYNNNPFVAYRDSPTGNFQRYIRIDYYTSSWFTATAYDTGGSFRSYNPNITYLPPSIASEIDWGTAGRNTNAAINGAFLMVCSSLDATYSNSENIILRAAVDNPAPTVWFDFGSISGPYITQETVSSRDQQTPCINYNQNGDILINWSGRVFVGATYWYNIREIIFNASTDTWGSINNVTNDEATRTTPSCAKNYHKLSKNIIAYDSGSEVSITGIWSVLTEIKTLVCDIRLNIDQHAPVGTIASYLYTNDIVGLTVTGSASIVDSAADENYTSLTNSNVLFKPDQVEHVAVGSVGTKEEKVTMLYEITRALTTDDVQIDRILGGVA